MDLSPIERWVEQQLTPHRWQHTLGVATTAVQLAERYGCNPAKVKLAALCHDCARELPKAAALKHLLEFGILADEMEASYPVLLHGPIAAELVRRRFGIDDPAVLDSIRYHTTGRPRMCRLERILYVADTIEPGRRFTGVDELRRLAMTDLDKAVLACMDAAIRYLLNRGAVIHPRSLSARNWLLHELDWTEAGEGAD